MVGGECRQHGQFHIVCDWPVHMEVFSDLALDTPANRTHTYSLTHICVHTHHTCIHIHHTHAHTLTYTHMLICPPTPCRHTLTCTYGTHTPHTDIHLYAYIPHTPHDIHSHTTHICITHTSIHTLICTHTHIIDNYEKPLHTPEPLKLGL